VKGICRYVGESACGGNAEGCDTGLFSGLTCHPAACICAMRALCSPPAPRPQVPTWIFPLPPLTMPF